MLALGSGLLMIYSILRLRRCKSLKSNEEGVCVHVSFFGLELERTDRCSSTAVAVRCLEPRCHRSHLPS